jgi:hypothetical protein
VPKRVAGTIVCRRIGHDVSAVSAVCGLPMKPILVFGSLSAVVLAVGSAVALTIDGSAPRAQVTSVGTTIGGLPAAALDRKGLTILLGRAAADRPADLTIVVGARHVTVTTSEIGHVIDIPATVDWALRNSSSGRSGREVAPVLSTAGPSLDGVVARVQKAAEVGEFHGGLRLLRGTVEVRDPAGAQTADRETIRHALIAVAASLRPPASVSIAVRRRASHVTRGDLDRLALLAGQRLARPVELQAGSRTARVAAQALGARLMVVPLGSTPGHAVTLALDPTARDAVAVPAARALSVPAQEPGVFAPPARSGLRTQGSVRWRPVPSRTTVTRPGRSGVAVEPAAVFSALTQFLDGTAAGAGPLPVAWTVLPPHSSDAAAGTIDAMLGTFTTPFRCCQPRVKNIALIARTVDGTLIGPGQAFSLNGIVGRRTKAKGYVEAPFILDGELSTDIGGGVSQFATTTLNAAFFAGVELDRHQPHSFYISRYPPGREATVNYPTIDLRWTNDTGAPILIRAATTATSLTVTLYGRDDGRVVTGVSGPRIPLSGRDFRITVSRTISVPGRATRRQTYTTSYNKPPKGE